MNEKIEEVLKNFKVNDVEIPIAFLRYKGNKTDYITYSNVDSDNELYGDDELLNYIEYYDFDIYSKGNYLEIIKQLKKLLEANGFRWEPSLSSQDLYEDDTGYFHKTLCFSHIRCEEMEE